MTCGARSGLKRTYTLQWHLGEARWREAHQGCQKRQRLLQMSVKGRSGLLQGSDGQGLGRAQPQVVGVTAYGAMSAPGGSGQTLDLAMGGETTVLAHKAKRREGRELGKPGRALGLKSQQTA